MMPSIESTFLNKSNDSWVELDNTLTGELAIAEKNIIKSNQGQSQRSCSSCIFFNVPEQTLSQAAKDLKELGRFSFGLTNDDAAMSNARRYSSSQRTGQQFISIGMVDKLSLAPGQMLVDPIIGLCMKW